MTETQPQPQSAAQAQAPPPPPSSSLPLILNTLQAAKLLGVSAETLRQWYGLGIIPKESAFRVGRLLKFRRPALEEFAKGKRPGTSTAYAGNGRNGRGY